MNIKVSEFKGKLICNKSNHNEPISMVIMDDSIQMSERFLCTKCIQSKKVNVEMLELQQVRDLIKEKSNQQKSENEQQRQRDFQILKKFQQKMKQYQAKIIKDFETTQQIIQQWINAYEIKEDDNSLKNLIKGLELLNGQQEFGEINQSYYQKLDQIMKKVINLNDFYKTYDLLKELQKSECKKKIKQQQEEQDLLKNIYEVQYIDKVKSNQFYQPLAFNITGSIMVSGMYKGIKVWEFEKGKLREKLQLSGHTERINCLAFSRKLNWFFSGSNDHKILGWKEQENGEWLSSNFGYHNSPVLSLLLNKNEDELICSGTYNIEVWKVNGVSNNLNDFYHFDIKHTDLIYSLSMNESEDYLVSSSKDNKIILWHKDKQNKWQYQNELYNNDYGYKICFITDRQLIWQSQEKGIVHVLECCGGELIRKTNLNIQLNSETGDSNMFQIIFNKRKQIIILSHNKFVYFVKRQENGSLQLIQDPKDCTYNCGYGALTDDGEYFVHQDRRCNGFSIYKMKYML